MLLKSLSIKSINFLLILLLVLGASFGPAVAEEAEKKEELFLIKGEKKLKLLVDDKELETNYKLDFSLDARDLLSDTRNFPQLIKVKIFSLDSENQEELVSLINSSVFNLNQARNFGFSVNLPENFNASELRSRGRE